MATLKGGPGLSGGRDRGVNETRYINRAKGYTSSGSNTGNLSQTRKRRLKKPVTQGRSRQPASLATRLSQATSAHIRSIKNPGEILNLGRIGDKAMHPNTRSGVPSAKKRPAPGPRPVKPRTTPKGRGGQVRRAS